jgi:hypothetical protein
MGMARSQFQPGLAGLVFLLSGVWGPLDLESFGTKETGEKALETVPSSQGMPCLPQMRPWRPGD